MLHWKKSSALVLWELFQLTETTPPTRKFIKTLPFVGFDAFSGRGFVNGNSQLLIADLWRASQVYLLTKRRSAD